MSAPMTGRLEAAIGRLGARDRFLVAKVLADSRFQDERMEDLMLGLRAELVAAGWRENAALDEMERSLQHDIDAVDRRIHGDPAPVEGVAFWPEGEPVTDA